MNQCPKCTKPVPDWNRGWSWCGDCHIDIPDGKTEFGPKLPIPWMGEDPNEKVHEQGEK